MSKHRSLRSLKGYFYTESGFPIDGLVNGTTVMSPPEDWNLHKFISLSIPHISLSPSLSSLSLYLPVSLHSLSTPSPSLTLFPLLFLYNIYHLLAICHYSFWYYLIKKPRTVSHNPHILHLHLHTPLYCILVLLQTPAIITHMRTHTQTQTYCWITAFILWILHIFIYLF